MVRHFDLSISIDKKIALHVRKKGLSYHNTHPFIVYRSQLRSVIDAYTRGALIYHVVLLWKTLQTNHVFEIAPVDEKRFQRCYIFLWLHGHVGKHWWCGGAAAGQFGVRKGRWFPAGGFLYLRLSLPAFEKLAWKNLEKSRLEALFRTPKWLTHGIPLKYCRAILVRDTCGNLYIIDWFRLTLNSQRS